MTPHPLPLRLLIASAAVAITGLLFQSVASFARPTAIEHVALTKKATITVAAAR